MVDALLASWYGDAANCFARLWEERRLVDLATEVDTARANYTAAVDANTTMWEQVG